MVGIAIDGGETLLSMITDLLDVEQMESGSMHLNFADLNGAELVARAAAQVASLSHIKSLKISIEVSPDLRSFRGDEGKLRRVLVNLLGNAIKFTPAGGAVTVRARSQGAAIQFSVSDTGEGIPADAFERIFEKLGQVESRKGGRMMSTGLGLTFCRLAVEAHGGSIRVESVPGHGSTFFFSIPRAQVV